MSKSDQIAGSKQSQSAWTKKQNKLKKGKSKRTATFGWETDIMGVPIIPYPDPWEDIPTDLQDERNLKIPEVPKPEIIKS
tara:strand:- start:2465 stop:2704 length:240 start_codon:yes stop_codon:yes gene_type:complete